MGRLTQIEDAILKTGWSIKQVEVASEFWWAREIWEIKSLWSPQGRVLYMTFLIDPGFTGDWNNIPDSVVWSVGMTKRYPKDRLEAEQNVIYLTPNFERNVKEISALANRMRANG